MCVTVTLRRPPEGLGRNGCGVMTWWRWRWWDGTFKRGVAGRCLSLHAGGRWADLSVGHMTSQVTCT